MKIEFEILHRRIRFSAQRQVRVKGVTSRLSTGQHILMWDFDHKSWDCVQEALLRVQCQFTLPSIYVLKTREDSYHAYCLRALDWSDVIHIISSTAFVDLDYFRIGIWRGYFTLRITDKPGAPEIQHFCTLAAPELIDTDPMSIDQFVNYWANQ